MKHKSLPNEVKKQQIEITTAEPIGDSISPRQPNEHDLSPDSQTSPPREAIQQAAADVASGQENTDRYGQPEKNPKNNSPSTDSPKDEKILPDGRQIQHD